MKKETDPWRPKNAVEHEEMDTWRSKQIRKHKESN